MTPSTSNPLERHPDLFMPSIPRPLISLNQGKYLGSNLNHPEFPQPIQRWLNVPYAFPPIGNLRFRPPVPIPHIPDDPNRPITDASEWGKHCPQSMHFTPGAANDEDESCLNLNVFRPKNYFDDGDRGKKLLPVLVYIHGGGFNGGNARGGYMISGLVARAYTPIVGVTFNYRVGAFGFLTGRVAMEEGEEGGVNAGLKDQICVMEWVRKNIEAFGGDPGNVTVMGTSAGAHSIGHHLNNTDIKPLFHKAIIESGASTARACYPYNHPLHEQQFQDFISIIGCNNIPSNQLISHLRTLPAATILSASAAVLQKYNSSALRWPWQPVIGQSPIPRNPISSLTTGNWHKQIPILTGFNTNEGSMFILPRPINTDAEFMKFWKLLRPDFTEQDLKMLEELYPDPDTDPDSPYRKLRSPHVSAQTARLEAAYSDYAYIAPVQHTAFFSSETEGKGGGGVWLYEFAVKKTAERGADHGDHAGFVTGNRDITEFSEQWKEISNLMGKCWVGFIAGGDPNLGIDDRMRWEKVKYSGLKRELGRMVFGEGNTEGWGKGGERGVVVKFVDGGKEGERERRRDFWWARVGRF